MSNSKNELGAGGVGIELRDQVVEMASANILMESKTLKEVLETTVDKSGPKNNEFIYVDISSIDREKKKITAVKTFELSEAPSRAKQHLKEGDVLVSMTRPNLNAVAIVPSSLSGAIASTGFHVLRSNTVEPKFIYYLVQSKDFIEKMCQKVQGALYPAVRPRDIESYTFNFPSKKEQQRQIVAKIEELFSELDSGIASLKTAQQQLKIYRQALLKHAFEGKLTEQWRKDNASKLETPEQLLARIQTERETRYQQQLDEWKQAVKDWEAKGKEGKKPSKPVLPKSSDLHANDAYQRIEGLPASWAWLKLSDLLQNSPQNGLYKPSSFYGLGCQIIRIDNFYDGRVTDKQSLKRLAVTDNEKDTYGLKLGDLIVNRVNSIEYLGKSALIRKLDEPIVFESNIMRCTLLSKTIEREFIVLYLNTIIGRKELCKNAKHAVNQASINQTDVGNSFLPICSLAEQKEIVNLLEEKLSIIEQNEKEIEGALAKAELLRQSILKKAFNGQLVTSE